MALLINPANASLSRRILSDSEAAAATLGVQLHVLRASSASEIDDAFETVAKLQLRALVISPDGFFTTRIAQLGALTIRHRVATLHNHSAFAAAGGLMAYGSDIAATERLVGHYVGRILKGENAADLPVQQPTKVHLAINLRTAKALGVTITPALLLSADELFE